MFSRRHPYLFFILVFMAIVFGSSTMMSFFISSKVGAPGQKGEKIGVIEIIGVITDSKQILADIKRFREDDNIKAIVIRIDSPGGGVGPSQEIFRAINKAKKSKKIITSMGALAASGGYYAAAATNGIMANPGTITGSIGVIMGYTDLQGIFKKIGLSPVVIKSGSFKDTGSPVREMRQEEREFLQKFVSKIHDQFVGDVAKGRSLEIDHVKKLADGRIYTGEESVGLGLVDRLGNLEDAVDWAAKLAGVKGPVSIVYPPKPKQSLLEYLSETSVKAITGIISNSDINAGFLYKPGQ